jgi:hypothetical protein
MINNKDLKEVLEEALNVKVDGSEFNKKINTSIPLDSVKNFDSEKLCSIIASNRYININKDLEIAAMKELGKRRESGDPFNFENKIDEYSKRFTPIDYMPPDIINFISRFSGIKQ